MMRSLGFVLVFMTTACGSGAKQHTEGQAKMKVSVSVSDAAPALICVRNKTALDATPAVSAAAAAVEGYIERLADEHPSRDRWEAEQWLVAHPKVARARLTALAATGEPDLRVVGAIRVLGRIGAAIDVPVLAKLASAVPRRSGSWDACVALARHASPEAAKAMLKLLEHPNPIVVDPILMTIGLRKDQRMRGVIEAKLMDKNSTVRLKAVHALIDLGVGPSRKLLRKRLYAEPNAENRQLIRRALKKK